MPVIDGQKLSRSIRDELKAEVARLNRIPVLAVVLVGTDRESERYVNMKKRAAEEIGGQCRIHHLTEAATDEVVALVNELNRDPEVHGILVQLPLPPGVDQDEVIAAIDVSKDVDGFHPLNLGLGYLGKQVFTSCASAAILHLIDDYVASPRPRVLLVGDSLDLIKPLNSLLIGREYPVTVVGELEPWIDLSLYQVIVLEKGEPRSISSSVFRDGALVIDAGFHWLDGKTCGNAITDDFRSESGPYLLPVPGGLGPLLITMLLSNLVKAAGRNG
ncbi:MAG: bifunctional methylenetetrahydrofolate dehydrogenase/methenyltetrahydrofolate cyclohydrolase [Syntrophomonadaceae bacterium]|nr:bifunctional methylenetetrahydrofolate dehydrogenase/methenyltetrahydrofolate cyclohydrolase [Syntrophomonadaceae bacterium]